MPSQPSILSFSRELRWPEVRVPVQAHRRGNGAHQSLVNRPLDLGVPFDPGALLCGFLRNAYVRERLVRNVKQGSYICAGGRKYTHEPQLSHGHRAISLSSSAIYLER